MATRQLSFSRSDKLRLSLRQASSIYIRHSTPRWLELKSADQATIWFRSSPHSLRCGTGESGQSGCRPRESGWSTSRRAMSLRRRSWCLAPMKSTDTTRRPRTPGSPRCRSSSFPRLPGDLAGCSGECQRLRACSPADCCSEHCCLCGAAGVGGAVLDGASWHRLGFLRPVRD